ncbi:septum formation inhibitor Maf [Rhodobacter capsulatus]|uniref:Maf family protein n=1 Tax=Rhodobacter capsulatus TaxID=1061 RepID=UPI0006DCA7D1|nr:Maf family protein [Rhodobacter capsulatus]KQB12453.1 septum formation protein Maf [Rhodobacter capsulatus]KQB15971.1 septum formation protein Maf [Rhodobacter capsulatus]PZX26579.1 septum formation protein [Rhodobacter capsulatus]QNR62055.1 septum formation inhibitor Maf [Rhodobacter capsulatus]
MKLILGSASPRRRELLGQLGLTPAEVRIPDIDETPERGEDARAYVARMAREKAAVLDCAGDEVILTADTTVTCGRRILGKPADEKEAAEFLWLLSGRRHHVLTAVAVRTALGLRERLVDTVVKFRPLSNAEVNGYLASGEWQGKAGGYAIQGLAGAFVPWIQGSFTGVVGLPLAETAVLLRAAGLAMGEDA